MCAVNITRVWQNTTQQCSYIVYMSSLHGCAITPPCSTTSLNACLSQLSTCTLGTCACQGQYVACVTDIGCPQSFVQQEVANCEGKGCSAAQCTTRTGAGDGGGAVIPDLRAGEQ